MLTKLKVQLRKQDKSVVIPFCNFKNMHSSFFFQHEQFLIGHTNYQLI